MREELKKLDENIESKKGLKKLILHKETIKVLSSSGLRFVVGGASANGGCTTTQATKAGDRTCPTDSNSQGGTCTNYSCYYKC